MSESFTLEQFPEKLAVVKLPPGAEIPILNGINSAAVAHGTAAPSVSATQVAILQDMPIRIASSLRRVPGSVELSACNGLGIGIAPVNRAPVAVGPHVLLDQAPDAVLDLMETRLALHGQPPWPLDRHRDDVLDLSRTAAEHHDAIG